MSDSEDANQLRGFHFKRLLARPLTWFAIGLAMLAAAAIGTALLGPAIGAAIALAVLAIALAIVLAIADSKAEQDFFEGYSKARRMTLSGRGPLPEATPLLRRGDARYAERALSGPLAEGVDGILALYTYEEETTDGDGNSQTNYYRYTVALVEIPACATQVPELFCQKKFGLRSLEKFEDVFRRSKERVKLESEALDQKYEIFAGKGQDEVWLRRLFSPTFILWLTETAPAKFGFELVDGVLCCYVHGHKEDAKDLDLLRSAAAEVTTRLREESGSATPGR